ncbi:MAG: hypothetical protein WC071_01540, partial [Victivallaceae bacterium]
VLAKYGFVITDGTPELLIAHGGDGALFQAEREYPGIPKLPLRDSRTAPLCDDHSYDRQLEKFCCGETRITELLKLKGQFLDKKVLGINDIFIHNQERVNALRYRVWIDDELYANEIVGDGVGLATVHGSTAYYKSITHSTFRVGIGLAFSNSTEVVNHLVIADSSVVRIKIVRGPAIMVADNSPELAEVPEGEEVIIRKASEVAQVYGLDNFMCQKCRLLRHPNKYPFKSYCTNFK